jgi:TonB family protein
VQTIAVAVLVVYTLTAPGVQPASLKYVGLVAPELFTAQLKVHPSVTRIEPERIAASTPSEIQAPILKVQQPQRVYRPEVAPPQFAVSAPKFDSNVLNAMPVPKAADKIVALNTFGGSSAMPTLRKIARSQVQTGGFGDPNGVPVNASSRNQSNIATIGAFDLPVGGGYGNGTGGSSGARGTVVSAGFGSGVAVPGGGGRGGSAGQGRVQSTIFPNAMAAPAPNAARHAIAADHSPKSVPVTVQSKPTPVYTSEARQLRVEGEVLLKVVFTADGEIRILNVVRGLGHGLDEAAQRAAQGVKFIPAMRDGHPVDTNATLHIVFQLS